LKVYKYIEPILFHPSLRGGSNSDGLQDEWINSSYDWWITNEAQIIPSPFSGPDYLLFYCVNDLNGEHHSFNFRQEEITLNNSEKSQLLALADNSTGNAKYGARSILSFVYGNEYCDCITPIAGGNKLTTSSYVYSINDMAKAMGLSIEAIPNPAKVYTEFIYTLPFGVEKAVLNVFDISGKLMDQIQLNSPINKKAYNTSHLTPGSYTIEIKTKEYSYSTKLIVQ